MVKRFHPELAERLGRNITAFRKQSNFTQERLAEYLAVDVATVSRYETGSALPSLLNLEKVARLLHCTIADLLSETPPADSVVGREIEGLLRTLSPEEHEWLLNLIRSTVVLLEGKPENRTGRNKVAKDKQISTHAIVSNKQ